ncbi:MAG: YihY/virulence factor BrkB family protein [Oscillospiraceae bacterium]|nr:YihY/virulence factor BrkB family protein [Oscillospiraceae bacterium]
MKYYRVLRKGLQQLSEYRIPLYSANAAFYIILSVFPALILVVGLLPCVGYSESDLLSSIHGLVPAVLEPVIAHILDDMSQNSTGALLSLTAIIAVWSSSSGVYCIHVGLNAIHRVRESRGYLLRRLICVGYMLLLIAALMLTLIIHGFGQEIADWCQKGTVPILLVLSRLLQFRALILAVLLSSLFCAIYCVFPNRTQKPRNCMPGAIAAALGWLLFTHLFSFYVRHSNSYPLFYGSLSAIAFGMLWLYICICILFYGALFNLWLEKKRER